MAAARLPTDMAGIGNGLAALSDRITRRYFALLPAAQLLVPSRLIVDVAGAGQQTLGQSATVQVIPIPGGAASDFNTAFNDSLRSVGLTPDATLSSAHQAGVHRQQQRGPLSGLGGVGSERSPVDLGEDPEVEELSCDPLPFLDRIDGKVGWRCRDRGLGLGLLAINLTLARIGGDKLELRRLRLSAGNHAASAILPPAISSKVRPSPSRVAA